MSKTEKFCFWIDVLCFESVLKIFFYNYSLNGKIYYFQISKYFIPFLTILRRLTKCNFVLVNDYSLSEIRIKNLNGFQLLNKKSEKLGETISKGIIKNRICEKYVNKFQLTKKIIERYFYLEVQSYLFRALEMEIIIEDNKNSFKNILIIKKSPFHNWLENEIKFNVIFYNPYLSRFFKILTKEKFLIDGKVSEIFCYNSKLRSYFKRTYIATLNIFYYVFPNKINSLQEVGRSSNIGVDFLYGSVRPNEQNEFFWLKSKYIDPKTVYLIEENDPCDLETVENCEKLGIGIIKRSQIWPMKLKDLNFKNFRAMSLLNLFNVKCEQSIFIFFSNLFHFFL